MQYWLLKSEPETFSFNDLLKNKKTIWDGVRNFQARNNLKKMKKGDLAFFYHSIIGKEIVGLTEVSKEYFPDPTDSTGKWVVVEVIPKERLENPVTLENIKVEKSLSEIPLLKQSRLSVMPLSKKEFDVILKMSK